MSKKLLYFIGIALFLASMPIRGTSQTSDDARADKVERAHRKHVMHHAVIKTKRGIKHTYHKAAHAVMTPIDKAKAHHRADEKQEGETK